MNIRGVQRLCNTFIFVVFYTKVATLRKESSFYLSVLKLPRAVLMQDFRQSSDDTSLPLENVIVTRQSCLISFTYIKIPPSCISQNYHKCQDSFKIDFQNIRKIIEKHTTAVKIFKIISKLSLKQIFKFSKALNFGETAYRKVWLPQKR